MDRTIDRLYTVKDVEKLTGVERPRLNDWISRGFIKPSVPRLGRGKRNFFSEDDLERIAKFKKLVDMGLSRPLALKILTKRLQKKVEST